MKIRSLHLKNFKRFSDLLIEEIPDSSKLVLLIGSNGSGKSSIFDALNALSHVRISSSSDIYGGGVAAIEYYAKDVGLPIVIEASSDLGEMKFSPNNTSRFHSNQLGLNIYGRSSLRVVPSLKQNSTTADLVFNRDAPNRLIDLDERFHTDAALFTSSINKALREPLFKKEQVDLGTIAQQFIEPINSALTRVFAKTQELVPQLRQFDDATPTTPPKLSFQKGVSQFNFDFLSHGEKQVVVTLLNLSVRKEFLRGKVIFIDELDVHMHTALQKTLIEEIVTHWIADDSQLWVASHSLGFIEFAKTSQVTSIIDLDELNFDQPQRLTPEAKSNSSLFNVAVSSDTLQMLLNNRQVIFVENTDIDYLSWIINTPNRVALAAKDKYSAIQQSNQIANALSLVDKDYVTATERAELLKHHKNLLMLNLYSLENYLFHPDNIEEFLTSKHKPFDRKTYESAWLLEASKVISSLAASGGLKGARKSYSFYGELDQDSQRKRKAFSEATTQEITQALESNDFNKAFEFIPAKDFGATAKSLIGEFRKESLALTQWFKTEILFALAKPASS
jgi:energy-coupling factor transporter ATP-binding protein EcfA2